MSDLKGPVKNRTAGLVKALYVISAVIAVIFVYMVIVNVVYMKNYLLAYGMTFSDMWMDTIQYVITGSISYLVYAILVFCAGKVIGMLGTRDEAIPEVAGSAAEEPVSEEPAAEADEVAEAEETDEAAEAGAIIGEEAEPIEEEAPEAGPEEAEKLEEEPSDETGEDAEEEKN